MNVLPFLNRAIPIATAIKGLQKLNPRIGSFIQGAFASGFSADQTLDFIRNKFSNEYEEELENKGKSLRPDQMATLQQLRQESRPIKAAQTAISVGAGLAGGLSSLQDEPQASPQSNLAQGMQGQGSMAQGMRPDQTGNEMLANDLEQNYQQMQPPNQPYQPPQQSQSALQPQAITPNQPQNPIEAIAPELHKFLQSETQGGRPPLEALNLAKSKGFLKDIENVSKKLGVRLIDVMNQLYGGYGPSQSNTQQGGQGQQALMAILQKIQASRGKQ